MRKSRQHPVLSSGLAGALSLLLSVPAFAHFPHTSDGEDAPELCSASWFESVEDHLGTGDGQGHGPDPGSEEWKSVVEFRLGIRGEPGLPERETEAWCRHIEELLAGVGPSFACETVTAGSIEARVCEDKTLSRLDRHLHSIYQAALQRAPEPEKPELKAQQRGWIKGRNECWKGAEPETCIAASYQRRSAELQARYRLTAYTGPVHYQCEGNPANEVVATFFRTDPPVVIAERGDQVSVLFLERSASGSRYVGRNEILWEHQGEASITWGYGSPAMHCIVIR